MRFFRSSILLLALGVAFARPVLSATVFDAVVTPAAPPARTADQTELQISEKQQEIARLEREIEAYRKQIESKRGEAKTLTRSIAIVEQEIRKINTSIAALRVALEEIKLKTAKTERSISTTSGEIVRQTALLAEQVRAIDARDAEEGVLAFFFRSERWVDILDTARDLLIVEEKTTTSLGRLVDLKQTLEDQKTELDGQRRERAGLLALQSVEQEEARRKREERARALSTAKQREIELQGQVERTRAIAEKLKNEIYALQKIGVTISDAVRYGKLVADRAGIRPGFLLALLEVESRLGLNVGKGTYKNDMNPNQHEAFLGLMQKLGRNPDTTPVSKKPSYGWGGAMGPAQFLPRTWLGYEAEISRLTGHGTPDPWNIEDAFMAVAIKLARDGATSKSREGELRAAKQYISGNPQCTKQICNSYSAIILDKAASIEATLNE